MSKSSMIPRTTRVAAIALLMTAPAFAQAPPPPPPPAPGSAMPGPGPMHHGPKEHARMMAAKPMAKPDAQMQAVLDQLAALGGKPIETLTAVEARQQPSPTYAVKALLTKQGKSTAPEVVAKVDNRTYTSAGSSLPIRIYTPAGKGPFPVVVYYHGGGWVIADLDTYDAGPRALANGAKAIVVSAEYRKGPETKFPGAHDDALAAYKWVLDNAASFNGDPKRVAVAGESAGANLAANVAIAARDMKWMQPRRQLLVYPIADNDMDAPSYLENANAKPLNKPMMMWFTQQYLANPQQSADPRISLVKQPSLKGLPPATIITAQIDPLRSDGEKYNAALKKAGVTTHYMSYAGVTHEFFGMGAVLDKAKAAQRVAGDDLKASLAK